MKQINSKYVSFFLCFKCFIRKFFTLAFVILFFVGCKNKSSITLTQDTYSFENLVVEQPSLVILKEAIQKNSGKKSDLDIFAEAFEYITKNYFEKIPTTELSNAAIEAVANSEKLSENKVIPTALKGLMEKLDKYSTYLSYDDFNVIESKTRGHFGGVGIKISKHKEGALILKVIDDTPAERQGLLIGDVITHINSTPINSKSIKQISFKIRGKINTKINFNYIRNSESHTVQVTREKIILDKVTHEKHDQLVYLKITSFNENTYKSVINITAKLKPYNSIILDLRDNRGGLLDQAVEVSDVFLDKGKIVEIRGRKPEDNLYYTANKDNICPKCKIYILINKETASAAEILASSLHENGRALLIGEPSYGKGTVQTIVPLKDGSAIKFTTSIYITPSGNSLDENGLKPDIEFQKEKFLSPLCFDIKSGNDLILKCAKKLAKSNISYVLTK